MFRASVLVRGATRVAAVQPIPIHVQQHRLKRYDPRRAIKQKQQKEQITVLFMFCELILVLYLSLHTLFLHGILLKIIMVVFFSF